jgi:apolipoprotein N-acyltransferase
VLTAGLLLWSVRHARRRPRVVAGGLLAAVVAFVLPALVSPPLTEGGEASVAVVQGDVPGDGDNLLAFNREVTRSHLDLTRELAADVEAGEVDRPDLVLWPENSTAVDPFLDREIRQGIEEVTEAVGAPVLVGAIVDAPDESQVLNQGIVYKPGSGAGDRYTKRHPVPFGEYIPYRAAFGSGTFGRLDQIPRDMMSGTRSSPLRVDGMLLAAAICFDVAYDDAIGEQVRGGADLLTVQTSNALFIHTGQIEQQWQISRARALETGRTVVVAAVNGRSGVIGPDGEVRADITPRTRDVLVQEVALVEGTPPSLVVGPWLGRATVPVGVCAALWALLPYRRARGTEAVREPGRTTAGSRQ